MIWCLFTKKCLILTIGILCSLENSLKLKFSHPEDSIFLNISLIILCSVFNSVIYFCCSCAHCVQFHSGFSLQVILTESQFILFAQHLGSCNFHRFFVDVMSFRVRVHTACKVPRFIRFSPIFGRHQLIS